MKDKTDKILESLSIQTQINTANFILNLCKICRDKEEIISKIEWFITKLENEVKE